ncbi:YXWGXW repeat-containing protein [Mucilaginibacter sp. dw_454]|uniref:YXWGXW repeat-containing protein n=1 Tax=Mucilaginibacter sp. dw_454 TaxID=2720079 RepID=UPI001BD57193|nr:YXWGXW repeat-containing protein [Mucilaginibacter sp. dw_454]
MKTLRRILFATAALVLFSTVNSSAQIVVRARLYHRGPAFVRPVRPSANHVWIEGEWVPRGRTYVERPGYWAAAPRPHAVWIAGHWDRRRGGYAWVPGYWR